MPAAVGAVAGYFATEVAIGVIGGAFGAAAIGSATSWGVIVGSGIGLVVGSGVTSALAPSPKRPEAQPEVQSQQFESLARGALVNTASNVEPLPVIYGTRRKGGTRVLTEVTGDSNQFLHLVMALGEGEVSAIRTVYLDDVASTDSRFSGLVTIEKYVGADAQAASAAMVADLGGKWTSAHQGKGIAYLYLKLEWSETAFPTGLPVITADVEGRTVLDPRTSVTAFSNNPALCIRDYLTNSRYGRGIASALIDDATFNAAADHCDDIYYPLAGSPDGAQKRFTCDGLVDPDAGWVENLRALLSSCRGMLVFSGGKYRLVLEKAETALTSGFTENNIVGAWQIENAGKREKFNRVRARFFNPDREWQPDIAIWDDTSHRTDDSELLLEQEISLPFTADLVRARSIAQLEEKRSRFGIVAQFRAMMEGMQCEVGDVVPITHSTPGWTAKPFRVMRVGLLSAHEVEVEVREYQAAAYALDSQAQPAIVPATNLPNPHTVTAPAGLTLASGTSELFVAGDGTIHTRLRVHWVLPADTFVRNGGRAEIQFQEFAGSPSEWSPSHFVDGSLNFAHVAPVDDGRQYEVRVRFENSLGVKSAFTVAGPHTIVGKTALPADVTGFSAVQQGAVALFGCDRVTDADLDSVEIRYGATAGSWSDGVPLVNILRGETSTSAGLPSGAWDVLAKAKDTSGNYSANAARISITVTSSGFTSIKAEAQAPNWLGARSNMVRHWTGVLTPESRSLASDLGFEVFDQFVPNAEPDCYYEAVEIDKTINASARVWATVGSVLGPGETSGVADPKFQIDYKLSTGSYDGFESWTIGSANFRYLKGRIYVNTALGKPVVTGFTLNVDNLSRVEEFLNRAIGASGTTVTFATAFHAVPNVQITPIGTTALIPGRESLSTTSLIAHLYNTAGTGVAGNADITVTGP